ncbi:MAG: DUF2268 domain-containing putative Zn-dependent protease, partial [Candidatus Nanohaloarchaea archaeon]
QVQKAIEASRYVLEKEEDFEVYLAWDGRPSVKDEQGGAQGRTYSAEVITAGFNSGADGWKDRLEEVIAHEYAHAWLYERRGMADHLWEWLLEEVLAQQFAEKAVDADEPQKKAVDREELAELWPGVKEVLDDTVESYDHDLFFGGDFPRWTGYSLAYLLGEKLLEDRELSELADVRKSGVIEAGDSVLD